MLQETKQENVFKAENYRPEPWRELNNLCKNNLKGAYKVLFYNISDCDKWPECLKFIAFDWENLKLLAYREPEVKIFSFEDYNQFLKALVHNEPKFLSEGMKKEDETSYKRILLFKDLDKPGMPILQKGDKKIKPGDFLSTCWGYDQTNVEIFVIKKILGKNYLIIQEVCQDKEDVGPFSYRVKINETIRKIDIPIKAYISNDGYISVCESGYKRSLSITELDKTHYSSDGH